VGGRREIAQLDAQILRTPGEAVETKMRQLKGKPQYCQFFKDGIYLVFTLGHPDKDSSPLQGAWLEITRLLRGGA
jgi:hypothetical protein